MDIGNDLDRLAVEHGSDKFGAHRYTPHYHRYFAGWRDRPIRLLEIGIGGYDDVNAGGASLRMWADYFPLGQIHGLDLFDKSALAGDRIHIAQGSQTDPRAVAALVDATPDGLFDIIVDDGSHRVDDVVTSFLMLFQFVREGGWYVVEDVETAYWPRYGGSPDPTDALNPIRFFQRLADGLNWQSRYIPRYQPSFHDRNVATVHFYHNLVFIQRGPPN